MAGWGCGAGAERIRGHDPAGVSLPINSVALTDAIEKAKTYACGAHASETHRAYRNDWHAFQFWCPATGCSSLLAE